MIGRRPTQKEYEELKAKKDFDFTIDQVTIYPNGKYHIETLDIDSLVNMLLGD